MKLSRKRIVVAGLSSFKARTHRQRLDALALELEAAGAVVVGVISQRRGVSRGGVKRLEEPMSRGLLLGVGKADELAALCTSTTADAVIFTNELTREQQRNLTQLTGVAVNDARSIGLTSWLRDVDE